MSLKLSDLCSDLCVFGIIVATPNSTNRLINVRIMNTILDDPSVNDSPPSNGMMIVTIPFTTISDARNFANKSPSYLSPAKALAITIIPPAVNPWIKRIHKNKIRLLANTPLSVAKKNIHNMIRPILLRPNASDNGPNRNCQVLNLSLQMIM